MDSEFVIINFIHEMVQRQKKVADTRQRVHTRFPEPNGYRQDRTQRLCDFGSRKVWRLCNLVFDDTNPEKEDEEYVEAIKEDIKWLGSNGMAFTTHPIIS